MGAAFQAESNAAAVPLELTIDQPGVGGVTGCSPTVALRNISAGAPLSYLDWATQTFKAGGWTTKNQPMSEVGGGHYEQLLALAALRLAAGTQLSAEYAVNNGAGIVGVDADLISVVQVGQEVDLLRKVAMNRLEEASGNPGTLTLYDDDGASVLETWQLRDEFGNAVLPSVGTPAKRGAGSP